MRGTIDTNIGAEKHSLPDGDKTCIQDEQVEVEECSLSDFEIETVVY